MNVVATDCLLHCISSPDFSFARVLELYKPNQIKFDFDHFPAAYTSYPASVILRIQSTFWISELFFLIFLSHR